MARGETMKYALIVKKIQDHLEHEPSAIKRQILRDTARELRYESRYEPRATENYYLTMIGHALRMMDVKS